MNEAVAQVIVTFLYILVVCVVLRALMSWFPISRDNPLARALVQVTDPILEPVRRIIPPIGMIDISALVVIIVLTVMIQVVEAAAAS